MNEFHHADNGLTLLEFGRWRSQRTLEWIIANQYDGIPDTIREEINHLCSQISSQNQDKSQAKTRQPTPSPVTRSSGSCKPGYLVQPPVPPAPPKRAPPALPVSHNPDISQGNDMKESVKKALSFQRPDPAAIRAALQAAGGFRSESSSATRRVPDAGQVAEPPVRQDTAQLAGTFFFARRPIGSCNLVLFVHHRLMRGEKSVHDSRIGAKPFVQCET